MDFNIILLISVWACYPSTIPWTYKSMHLKKNKSLASWRWGGDFIFGIYKHFIIKLISFYNKILNLYYSQDKIVFRSSSFMVKYQRKPLAYLGTCLECWFICNFGRYYHVYYHCMLLYSHWGCIYLLARCINCV